MNNGNKYGLKPFYQNHKLWDLEVEIQGRSFRLMGRFARQLYQKVSSLLESNPDALPVLLGSGSADFVRHVVQKSAVPVAVVDREHAILQMTGADKVCLENQLLWVDQATPEQALDRLTTWQNEHGHRPFLPIAIPSYLRIDPDYYKSILSALEASSKYDFWSRTRYTKFQGEVPRILLISSGYFLMGEIMAACRRQQIPHAFLNLENQEMGSDDFIREFLTRVLEFKPDFVFTINHLGVDREGVLMDLLKSMELPLASWFVDNPHLILYYYKNLA
ncbi:MAG: hypothetical protein ACOCPN_03735, partial [Desulfonatronovibrionaceae bacterium]